MSGFRTSSGRTRGPGNGGFYTSATWTRLAGHGKGGDPVMDARGWVCEFHVSEERAAEVFSREPEWTVYALGDLEPPFARYSSVSVARNVSDQDGAACLTLRHPAFTAIISAGADEGLDALLDKVELPVETMVSIREEHRGEFERRFEFPHGLHRMRRMVLDRDVIFAAPNESLAPVRLGRTDVDDLTNLYSQYRGSSFDPDHLVSGVFFGVRIEGELVAVAGTHVVSVRWGVAAIGSVFTLQEHRGRGFAHGLTGAVARELRTYGCEVIALNVAVENVSAERVYRRLGFRDHCFFLEGDGTRR